MTKTDAACWAVALGLLLALNALAWAVGPVVGIIIVLFSICVAAAVMLP